jgi:hypothetical protein
MSLAENRTSTRRRTDGRDRSSDVGWPDLETFEKLPRSPKATIRTPTGRRMTVHTDRVRAKPAISPSLSMNIGLTAIGLGLWGTLFPRHVKKTLGLRAPTGAVLALFGARELATGFTLAGDPTKSSMLWARVAGDVFDIAMLRSLDNPGNRQRGTARAALAFVAAVTALDLVTAVRMTNVKRNCA